MTSYQHQLEDYPVNMDLLVVRATGMQLLIMNLFLELPATFISSLSTLMTGLTGADQSDQEPT